MHGCAGLLLCLHAGVTTSRETLAKPQGCIPAVSAEHSNTLQFD
jgi:hypothetical protein